MPEGAAAAAQCRFHVVQDTHNRTVQDGARPADRRIARIPVCAGCHAITDPIGLAMENYDAVGDYRTHENGALIDASGTFEGKPTRMCIGLQRLLHDSPSAPNCVAQRAYEYGVGRAGRRGRARVAQVPAQALRRQTDTAFRP